MADLTPFERLQPCLLDRLADDEPDKKEESRTQRVVSLQRYRRGVLRDIEWLFNASAHLPDEGGEKWRLKDFPQVMRSVMNFGTRQLYGLIAPDMDELQRELTETIRVFEPRIIGSSLVVNATLARNIIAIEINGQLWANPVPEQLFIKTKIDLETGQCWLGDSGHG